VQGHKDRIRLDAQPGLDNEVVFEITSGVAQKYHLHRMNQ
jgi:hypothetical protein